MYVSDLGKIILRVILYQIKIMQNSILDHDLRSLILKDLPRSGMYVGLEKIVDTIFYAQFFTKKKKIYYIYRYIYTICPADNATAGSLGRLRACQLRFGFVAVSSGHIVYAVAA
jgi:hypothetical protein